ncbi:MAG TPA: M23 family metallopeptidase [Bacteroidia bacterium]|nr:M23 family metallopeptidase [Sphingobacteriales bacterium]HPD65863.1 M23 family metallopeptidase [Bacteroidia bacterium]HRS59550.1 M23 family metallopeptidase [Bacteroidia bacterium]HRU67660.1 M23 family metallopeptidase [Bacteroidia bacterium]
MPKTKYRFNPELLIFEKHRLSFWGIVFRVVGISFTIIALAFVFNLLTSSLLSTPKERILLRELENTRQQYKILNEQLDLLEKVVNDLEYRDENIYRTLFEAEPIPSSVRNAGYGGVEKYKRLEGYSNSKMMIETTKKVDRLSKKLYILSKSYDEIAKLAENKEDMLASIPAIQPVKVSKKISISSGFGYRFHPIYKVRKFHEGLDFIGPVGTPIFATGNGTVIKTERTRSGYGNVVIINHGYGYQTIYAHLHTITVRQGQKVKRGEQIGTMGSTGLSTAPHLHYEVILGKTKLNPVFFFYNDLTPDEFEEILRQAEQANQTLD